MTQSWNNYYEKKANLLRTSQKDILRETGPQEIQYARKVENLMYMALGDTQMFKRSVCQRGRDTRK